MKETYGKDDKRPFGGYIAYQQLRKVYSNTYIQPMYEAFEHTSASTLSVDEEQKHSLYMIVAKDLQLDYADVEAMYEFVTAGNDLFISADYIDPILLEKFELNTERGEEISSELKGEMRDTKVKLYPLQTDTGNFGYYYFPALNFFSGFNFDQSVILGWNENSKPNYVGMMAGRGRLYLHNAPRSFGNYFLLKNENHVYLEQVVGYFREDPKFVYWDEYYKSKSSSSRKRQGKSGSNQSDFSSFKVINENPPLKWAFWLSIVLLLLFALFNMKRRQRIIPPAKPNVNTTVAFTETIGRLYLQKKNNKNISDKMITYFYEHLRNKYYLSATQLNTDFTTTLARKSGVSIQQIDSLFRTISSVQSSPEVEDFQLLSLNEQIQNFYKNKN